MQNHKTWKKKKNSNNQRLIETLPKQLSETAYWGFTTFGVSCLLESHVATHLVLLLLTNTQFNLTFNNSVPTASHTALLFHSVQCIIKL